MEAGYAKRAPFARAIGHEVKTLQRLEDGLHVPTLGVLIAIARVAGVRFEWLATGEGPMREEAAA